MAGDERFPQAHGAGSGRGGQGARAGDETADVTLTASRETFEGIMDGSVNPTMAFMTGKLKVDGDMGAAMRLGSALG